MALNKFMHPRNPYRTPPDFKQLAIEYPEFRKHVQQELSGKLRVDFKDSSALRALTETLLAKDFSLSVELPEGRLVPTLPLRLNYLLWIEDLLDYLGLANKPISGIDIGTGASCIYPLLAARKFGWSMIATEIDQQSVEFATSNVERNNLSDKIKVRHVEEGTVLAGACDNGKTYDFSMCNPPFFKEAEEAGPHPPGSAHEIAARGGELAFIERIIADSAALRQSVRLYTTMIGVKSHVSGVKRLVRECGARSMTSTELCQGRTVRWAVAWTFMPDVDLVSAEKTCGLPKTKPYDKRPPLSHLYASTGPSDLDTVKNQLEATLTKLQITIMMTSTEESSVGMTLVAYKNTWSHQRRKRRNMKMAGSHVAGSSDAGGGEAVEHDTGGVDVASHATGDGDAGGHNSGGGDTSDGGTSGFAHKRTLRESNGEDEPAAKKARVESEVLSSDGEDCYESTAPLLVAILILTQLSAQLFRFEVTFVEGSGGREAANQVLQYIKNNFK